MYTHLFYREAKEGVAKLDLLKSIDLDEAHCDCLYCTDKPRERYISTKCYTSSLDQSNVMHTS